MKDEKTHMSKKDEAVSQLHELLKSEQYTKDARLPSESELMKILGCCRGTVREAVGTLINEGILYRLHGSGTYVARNKQPQITIAALFPSLCIESYSRYSMNIVSPIVSAIVAEATKNDVNILLYGCGADDPAIERRNIKNAIEQKVDAAIALYIGAEQNLDCLNEMKSAGIPMVFVDRYIENFDCDYVITDNFKGLYDTVNAIAGMGIENIYYVTISEAISSTRDRMLGYTAAVNDLGLPCNVMISHLNEAVNEFVQNGVIDRESSQYISLKKTIEGMKFPAALLSINPFTNAFVHAILEDLKIPNDQVLLGHFDSNPPAREVDR